MNSVKVGRRSKEGSVDGILVINKDLGMTSHDVVARVRKLLKQKRVGHTGTLDPLASGVLPLCIGQATRVAEYLSEDGKAYEAEIVFGTVTDTYDREGTVVRTANTDTLTREDIVEVLSHFMGKQWQLPPRYSAIKIQGQPAYKFARAGAEVTLEARPIEIFALDILAWHKPTLVLRVECGKGTYIRSLAYDLGEQLGCGGYLGALTRTRSGPFTVADSITLERVAELSEQGTVEQALIPADRALQSYPACQLDEEGTWHVLHGNAFSYPALGDMPEQHIARVYSPDGMFIAIAYWDEQQRQWQPKKVLAGHSEHA
jgi:tRNA pseudouridine55 synthase